MTTSTKGSKYKFAKLPKLEECDPGIDPHEFAVLVLPRWFLNMSPGGIEIPQELLDRENDAVVQGMLVRISPAAFSYAEWPDAAATPQTGQFVYFNRYAGFWVDGDDGLKYRLMNDKDIRAVRAKEKLDEQGAW